MLNEQIKAVTAERDALCAKADETSPQAMLKAVKGIGAEFANILTNKGLFRQFDNRREVAAYAGLPPSPWRSSSIDREQGASMFSHQLAPVPVMTTNLFSRSAPTSVKQ